MSEPNQQLSLSLIRHRIRQTLIGQRAYDGYIDAMALCLAAGKKFEDYAELESTNEFWNELAFSVGTLVQELIQYKKNETLEVQEIWVHPQVAIHLGQWASPAFAVKVTKWVFDWMQGLAASNYEIPYHIRRYLINRNKIPPTHFSMLDQMTFQLFGKLENESGYVMPVKLMPDISFGRTFSNWCRDNGHDPDDFPTYQHVFDDGKRPPVSARLYPNELLTAFNLHIENWIISGQALKYFSPKDQDAIEPIKTLMKQMQLEREKRERLTSD